MLSRVRDDVAAVRERDPACTSTWSALTNYPGLWAIWWHRLTHAMHRAHLVWLARFTSQIVRWWTGIEIHPGATIGDRFFIDHGMGVVIGETAEIGDDCLLYQGVTLGGTGKEKGKRHPSLGNSVVVGTGAKVLGNIRIGDNVKIGAGSVVIHSVPDNSTVVGIPGRVVRSVDPSGEILEHGKLPDPEGQAIEELAQKVASLEESVRQLLAERRPPADS